MPDLSSQCEILKIYKIYVEKIDLKIIQYDIV